MKAKQTLMVIALGLFTVLAIAPSSFAAEGNAYGQERNISQEQQNDVNPKAKLKANGKKIQTEIKELSKKYPKIRIGRAELVEIKGSSLPTEIVVKVIKPENDTIRPDKVEKLDNVEKMEIEKLYTIKVDEDTRFFRRFWGQSQLSEMTVGDHLWLVVADFDNVTYKGLVVKDNSIFLRGVRGTVDEVDYENNSFVMKRGDRILKVKLSDRTKLIIPGVKNPTIKDIRKGERVRTSGVINGRLKTMDAWKIKVYRLQPAVTVAG